MLDFYGQLLQFAETYKEEGMFRIWLGVVPVIALYKAELSEVSAAAFICLLSLETE